MKDSRDKETYDSVQNATTLCRTRQIHGKRPDQLATNPLKTRPKNNVYVHVLVGPMHIY